MALRVLLSSTALAVIAAFTVACSASSGSEVGTDDEGALAESTSSALLGFICECKATGPGVEDTQGNKQCAYACDCDGYTKDAVKKVGHLDVGPMQTQAFSWESWDRGSHICHGQYAFRPTLSSPNWEIKVKFSPFKITHLGRVFYANAGGATADPDVTVTERVETSMNVTEEIQRTAQAPEVRDAIAKKLGVVAPK